MPRDEGAHVPELTLVLSSATTEPHVLNAGYHLDVDEVEQLLNHVDTAHTGVVAKSQLAASQIDWEAMQQSNAERWLASARKVFQDFDTDRDGIISSEQIVDCLRSKIPPSEVRPFQSWSCRVFHDAFLHDFVPSAFLCAQVCAYGAVSIASLPACVIAACNTCSEITGLCAGASSS